MNCYHNTMNKISLALHLSSEWHDGQVDKAGKPYILHPLNLAMQFKDNEEFFCIAMMHDVVEDCNIPIDKIYNNFGQKIGDGVSTLTHKKGDSYFDYIVKINYSPWSEIKIADLKHNIDILRLNTILNINDYYRLKKYQLSYLYLTQKIGMKQYLDEMNLLKKERENS